MNCRKLSQNPRTRGKSHHHHHFPCQKPAFTLFYMTSRPHVGLGIVDTKFEVLSAENPQLSKSPYLKLGVGQNIALLAEIPPS